MANLNAARLVCERLGLDEISFIRSMSTFEGAAKRLQRIGGNDRLDVFLDFAHSPSKLRATLAAVKERFGNRQVVACIELHTYSSLNKDFLPQYRGTMDEADEAIVYFNPHALELKRLNKLSHQDIREAFGRNDLQIFDDSAALYAGMLSKPWSNRVLLLMSSGNFNGMNFAGLAEAISK
jgi:UDP-N-acetylmuramate: L-alanyl-gamma-D-glutamyl-meso-diaminopimelate ligase